MVTPLEMASDEYAAGYRAARKDAMKAVCDDCRLDYPYMLNPRSGRRMHVDSSLHPEEGRSCCKAEAIRALPEPKLKER